jgi:chromosome segregation ATPase
VTGILLGSTIAAVGLLVIPARRSQAKGQLSRQISQLREKLAGNLTTQFEHELGRSLSRLAEAVAPYTRFVRAERSRLDEAQAKLATIREQLAKLKARVEAM